MLYLLQLFEINHQGCVGKNLERGGRDIFEGTILTFA
jgi:hypothetical protein